MFGLLGFSYLHEEGEEEPVAESDPRLAGVKGAHPWAAHLVLFTREVLDEYPNANSRAQAVFKAIAGHQARFALQAGGDKFILSLTPNLIKVIKLTSVIADLKSQLSRLKEEKQRAEAEKQRAELYKKKLAEHGITDELD
ncbi:MAG: hypothetical protein Kow0069_20940 [Promethearchaeota archaeon]